MNIDQIQNALQIAKWKQEQQLQQTMLEIQTLVNQTHCTNSFHVIPHSPLKVFEEDGSLEPKAAVIMD